MASPELQIIHNVKKTFAFTHIYANVLHISPPFMAYDFGVFG